MRNDLESYIYDMRDKIISESHLAPFASDEEKKKFSSLLETTENWLYEDGYDATKSVYAEKLQALKECGTPIEVRQQESLTRPNAMTALQRTIEKYQSWSNSASGDEQYSHITEEEFMKCREACDVAASWMYDVMDKQGLRSSHQDPIVTTAEINAKTNDLTKTISPIMHKPKPKPKPVEKKEDMMSEDNATGTEEAKGEESKTTEPMETDEAPPTNNEAEQPEAMDTSEV
jgi:hypothetical protein